MLSRFTKFFKRSEPTTVPDAQLTVKYTKIDEATKEKKRAEKMEKYLNSDKVTLTGDFENFSPADRARLTLEAQRAKAAKKAMGVVETDASGSGAEGSESTGVGTELEAPVKLEVEPPTDQEQDGVQASATIGVDGHMGYSWPMRARRSSINDDADAEPWLCDKNFCRSYLSLFIKNVYPEEAPPVESFTPFFPPDTRPEGFSALIGTPSPGQYSEDSGNFEAKERVGNKTRRAEPTKTK